MLAARPAVFLDKDGTLVEDVPYNVDPGRLVFTRHALAALRRLDAAGFALVVVSNQPGLATGRFTQAEFDRLCTVLRARVQAEAGVALTGVHACPHAAGEGGRPACACRKPAAGLLQDAARIHGLDLARSWMVGDILDDVEAGARAGARSILLDVGHETVWHVTPLRTPRHRVADLLAAAELIVGDARAPAAARRSVAAPNLVLPS